MFQRCRPSSSGCRCASVQLKKELIVVGIKVFLIILIGVYVIDVFRKLLRAHDIAT